MAGLAATFGSGAMTNSIQEMEDAEVFLVIGSNTTEQHPLIATRMINAVREKKAKLIVADPRETKIAKLATLHISHNIGSDVALLNGLMHIIIKEGWEASEYIKTRTENFEKLREVVEKYTPERVFEITGVDESLLRSAAEIYAKNKKSMILYSICNLYSPH